MKQLFSRDNFIFYYDPKLLRGGTLMGEYHVATVGDYIQPTKEDLELTPQIVRACNSHAALVEALECERARDYLNAEGGSPEMREVCLSTLVKYGFDKNGDVTYQQWVDDKTIAALALAKGE